MTPWRRRYRVMMVYANGAWPLPRGFRTSAKAQEEADSINRGRQHLGLYPVATARSADQPRPWWDDTYVFVLGIVMLIVATSIILAFTVPIR